MEARGNASFTPDSPCDQKSGRPSGIEGIEDIGGWAPSSGEGLQQLACGRTKKWKRVKGSVLGRVLLNPWDHVHFLKGVSDLHQG